MCVWETSEITTLGKASYFSKWHKHNYMILFYFKLYLQNKECIPMLGGKKSLALVSETQIGMKSHSWNWNTNWKINLFS